MGEKENPFPLSDEQIKQITEGKYRITEGVGAPEVTILPRPVPDQGGNGQKK